MSGFEPQKEIMQKKDDYALRVELIGINEILLVFLFLFFCLYALLELLDSVVDYIGHIDIA